MENPPDFKKIATNIAVGLDRRGFGFDEEIEAYTKALRDAYHTGFVQGARADHALISQETGND